jgi:hypothetical protein
MSFLTLRDHAVHTVRGAIRVPTVIVVVSFVDPTHPTYPD